jgi:UDP-N-acetylenolpyruvoylglucosamine reductase
LKYDVTEAAHIYAFASDVRASVDKAFAIRLEVEPSVLA